MHRGRLYFLLLTSPLLACADDASSALDGSSTGGGSGDDGMTAGPTTLTTTPGDDGITSDDSTTSGLDSTGTGEPGSSSGEPGSSSGEPGSSSGEPGSSSGSTTAADTCGDDMQDAGEECDGVDLAGYTCVTLGMGFVDGVLACANDCTFDLSGCTTCGNDTIDGTEACDGIDLGANTCVSEGFVDGTLACTADCTLDTSACSACGDGDIDAGEDCDGAALGGQTCIGLGMGFTGGTLGCDGTCGYDTTACTSTPLPGAGEVVISEIMQNPDVLGDADGEWFEVFNPTMGAFQLGSCVVEGGMTDNGFTIDGDLEIGPMEYRVFSVESAVDQGFVPDLQWPSADFNLSNTSDTVRLSCDGVLVDEVVYDDGATFPDPTGASMSLDPGSSDATANDDGTNWCEGSTSYNGDLGTPGTANPVCMSVVEYTIDFCRLQFPLVVDEVEGTDVDAFGRLFVGGLTDLTGGNDPAAEVIGWVGYGPDGTDPAIDATWVWTQGTPNPGYGPASPNYEANNDEYQAVLTVPSPPGSYDFAFRFSGDGGTTFTYCDGQPAGSSDGYAAADAGQMTSNAAPPPPNLYFSEYVEGSSNNKALEIYNASGASADVDDCVVNFYFNGSDTPSTTIALAGSVAADDVIVVCDDDIVDTSACDILSGSVFYNGDDAIELSCGLSTLDVIGQIEVDPGAEWLTGGIGTQNETIRRACAVTTGDPDGSDPFDPSAEWATFPQDDLTDLGQHDCP